MMSDWIDTSLLKEYLEISVRLIIGVGLLLAIIWYAMNWLRIKQSQLREQEKASVYGRLPEKKVKVQPVESFQQVKEEPPEWKKIVTKNSRSSLQGNRIVFRLQENEEQMNFMGKKLVSNMGNLSNSSHFEQANIYGSRDQTNQRSPVNFTNQANSDPNSLSSPPDDKLASTETGPKQTTSKIFNSQASQRFAKVEAPRVLSDTKKETYNLPILKNISSETYVQVMSMPFTKPNLITDFRPMGMGSDVIKGPSALSKRANQPYVGMDEIRRHDETLFREQQKRKEQEESRRRKQEEDRQAKAKAEREKRQAQEKIKRQKEEDLRQQQQKEEQARLEAERKAAAANKLKADAEAQAAKEKAEQEAQAARERQAKQKQDEDRKRKAQEDSEAAQRERQRNEQQVAARAQADKKKQAAQRIEKLKAGSEIQLIDQYVEYSKTITEGDDIETAMNSIQDCRRNVKDTFIFTESLLESFDRNNFSQQNTFMVRLWDIIVMKLIRSAKREGVEQIPPSSPEAEIYKNNINMFLLIINLMKVKGQIRLWDYFVGKTLHLLEFIYKREQQLKSIDELDLVRNRYLSFRQEFERIYVSRIDQLTYFLFGLLTLDPYESFTDIVSRAGGRIDPDTQTQIENIKVPWDYSLFWILVSRIRKLPFTYFKPIVYNNIFSLLYLEYKKSFLARTTASNPFCMLYRELVHDVERFQFEVDRSQEMKMLLDTDIDDKFAGPEFFDRVEPLAKRIHRAKKRLFQARDIDTVIKTGCILYYIIPMEVVYQ